MEQPWIIDWCGSTGTKQFLKSTKRCDWRQYTTRICLQTIYMQTKRLEHQKADFILGVGYDRHLSFRVILAICGPQGFLWCQFAQCGETTHCGIQRLLEDSESSVHSLNGQKCSRNYTTYLIQNPVEAAQWSQRSRYATPFLEFCVDIPWWIKEMVHRAGNLTTQIGTWRRRT